MKPLAYFLLLTILACTSPGTHTPPANLAHQARVGTTAQTLYDSLGLDALGLNREAFAVALRGIRRISPKKPVLLLADMTQPSTAKRLYVLDLKRKKVTYQTYVAHGRGSGGLRPMAFSNQLNSGQTSLGFYRALGSYRGKHGLSLNLKGLERGINDHVFARNIVLHGADYVCEDTIRRFKMLGRSQGCPAVPNALSLPLIQAAEGGACLFIYYPDPTYLSTSALAAP